MNKLDDMRKEPPADLAEVFGESAARDCQQAALYQKLLGQITEFEQVKPEGLAAKFAEMEARILRQAGCK